MGLRLEFHELLVVALGSGNVYFQPLPNIKMKYPCIVYERSKEDSKYANNQLYSNTIGYMVQVIDADPDSIIPGKVRKLPLCSFSRHYKADNLNHDVYDIYF